MSFLQSAHFAAAKLLLFSDIRKKKAKNRPFCTKTLAHVEKKQYLCTRFRKEDENTLF